MPVSGFTMVFAARLNDIVFARNWAPLPADLSTITGHWWHGATALRRCKGRAPDRGWERNAPARGAVRRVPDWLEPIERSWFD